MGLRICALEFGLPIRSKYATAKSRLSNWVKYFSFFIRSQTKFSLYPYCTFAPLVYCETHPRISPECPLPALVLMSSRSTLQALISSCFLLNDSLQFPIAFFFTFETHPQGRAGTTWRSSNLKLSVSLNVKVRSGPCHEDI
jgi:hypothetical protein